MATERVHRPAPLWRSLLYVPATADRFVAKAAERGADGIILDLEDSIPPDRKEHARLALAGAVAKVAAAGSTEILVRINRPWRLAVRDLEAAVLSGVDGLCLPKVDSADHIQAIDEVVGELETERGLPVGRLRYAVLVETAKGVHEVRAIAQASLRVAAITMGGEDLSADLGLPAADPAASGGARGRDHPARLSQIDRRIYRPGGVRTGCAAGPRQWQRRWNGHPPGPGTDPEYRIHAERRRDRRCPRPARRVRGVPGRGSGRRRL